MSSTSQETERRPPDGEVRLPDALVEQLHAFEKRLFGMDTVVTVCGGLLGILLTYGVLLASDRLWDTPRWLRVPLTLAGGTTLACFTAVWLRHWWWRRRNARSLAKLVQHRYRRLGDRLLGAVELAESASGADNVSPALCRAAIRQVAHEAERYDFRQAVATRAPRLFALLFALIGALILAALLAFPQAGYNALLRWIRPLADVQRYTFVRIEDLPGNLVVAHGEDFELTFRLGAASRWRPTTAVCRIGNQPEIQALIVDGAAQLQIPGQTQPGTLAVHVGDVTRKLRVTPVFRPDLIHMDAEVELPAYLERPPATRRIANGLAEFLAGSRVRLSGSVSRELASATLTRSGDEPLAVSGAEFTALPLAAEDVGTATFTWIDKFNLTCAEPYVLDSTTTTDQPPVVNCRGVGHTVAMLEDEVLTLELEAEDDFGVQRLWTEWGSFGPDGEPDLAHADGVGALTNGSPTTTRLPGAFTFSPLALGIPEESLIWLRAFAIDYRPDRDPAASLVYRIYVLSRVQHAKLIQERMELLQARIEDLARQEERLLADNQDLQKQSPEQMGSEETTAKLQDSAATERSQSEALRRLAEEGQEILQEALRNKDVPEETLRQWGEMLTKMAELSEGQMKQAGQALQQAAQSPPQRSEPLDEATRLEEEVLAALHDMEQDINRSIENMLAKSFVNRLKQAAASEREVADGMQELLPTTIGMHPDDLPVPAQEAVTAHAAKQKSTVDEVSFIQDDLAGFYNRTRAQRHKDVYDRMIEARAADGLDGVRVLIERNIGVQAIETALVWEEQLTAWAELLSPEPDAGGGEGGEGGQPLELADIEILIALMRAREREEALREQTRLVEASRETSRRYATTAKKLARKQYELAEDIRPLERRTRHPKLRRLIEKVGGEMMNVGMFLRRPQTDSQTIAIETEIIEILSNCISSGGGQGGAAGMLMAAMGMGASPAGGGNPSGGAADGVEDGLGGLGGPGGDGDAAPREIDKAGGMDTSTLPMEFRDVMKAYFNAIEQGNPR